MYYYWTARSDLGYHNTHGCMQRTAMQQENSSNISKPSHNNSNQVGSRTCRHQLKTTATA